MPVLAVFGPTASGKTAVADELARRIPAEIVSADSMQAYRGLPILTAQPREPAHLVGIWPLTHAGSVGEYAELAHAAIDGILASGKTALVVGGTGLYLRAALAELELPPAPSPGARLRAETLYEREGPEGAHAELARLDPDAAAHVHANDRRRVVRALELAGSGRSLRPDHDRLWADEVRHPTIVFGLEVPQAELEARIEARTRGMFDAGVEDEVRRALAAGISPTAEQALGLRDVAELPRDEAYEAIVRRTRRLVAYQRKWMRRIPGLVAVRADRPPTEVADEVLEMARARQRVPADRAG